MPDSNITTKVTNGKVAIELAKNLAVDSVNAGGNTLNNTGLTVGRPLSLRQDSALQVAQVSPQQASMRVINDMSNVLAGTDGTDAVNLDQINAVKAIANTGWKLTTDKTGTGAVAGSSVKQITPDETVTFIAGDNIAVEQAGKKVTVATKKDVVFDSVTAGGTVINNSGLSC